MLRDRLRFAGRDEAELEKVRAVARVLNVKLEHLGDEVSPRSTKRGAGPNPLRADATLTRDSH
jgi:hypothetical protein